MEKEMNENNIYKTHKDIFPFWDDLSDDDREYIKNNSEIVTYTAETHLHDGTTCSGLFAVKKGCLRVYIMSEDGKSVTLYRLHAGDMCMLAASCVIQAITFDVFVTAEEDSECLVVSGPAFAYITEHNPQVKIFALELAVTRFSDVMWVMQQILFMSADRRLAIFLHDEITRTGSDTVIMTHEQIAKYMGSAREVVSRLLKYFSAEGIVEVSRKGVKIIDRKRLRYLAF